MRKPTTGEPYAGEPHVRFGGRGGESLSYPYQSRPQVRRLPWIPAFAGMSASVMLSCQEGESPSDVKS